MESKKYGGQNPFKFKRFRGKRPVTSEDTDTPQGTPQVRFSAGDGTDHAAQPTSDLEPGDVITPEEETEEPQMSVPVSAGLLVIVTVVSLLGVCVHYGSAHC